MPEVTAIDVGQGDSTLLVSPVGKLLLVDAGGPVGGQATEFDCWKRLAGSESQWCGAAKATSSRLEEQR